MFCLESHPRVNDDNKDKNQKNETRTNIYKKIKDDVGKKKT